MWLDGASVRSVVLKHLELVEVQVTRGPPNFFFVFGTENGDFVIFGILSLAEKDIRIGLLSVILFFGLNSRIFGVNANEKMTEAVWAAQLSDNKHQSSQSSEVRVRRFTICRLFPDGTCLVLHARHQYRTSKDMNRLQPRYDTLAKKLLFLAYDIRLFAHRHWCIRFWSSRLSTCETCFVRRTFICIRRPFQLELTAYLRDSSLSLSSFKHHLKTFLFSFY